MSPFTDTGATVTHSEISKKSPITTIARLLSPLSAPFRGRRRQGRPPGPAQDRVERYLTTGGTHDRRG